MLNEILILQILTLVTLIFFINAINIITLWYLAGIYLVTLGLLLLLDDGDIFIGFLWIIDLGVGLIFFIFILHFSNFLYQKSYLDLSSRFFVYYAFLVLFLLIFFFFLSNPVDGSFNKSLSKSWFFFISWYDFYDFFFSRIITDLNLMREVFYYNSSIGFFIINFMIFYGIFGAINLTFAIKKIFNFLNFGQLKNVNLLSEANSTFFIRNQNFIRQQNTSTGTRVWIKNKKFSI